MWVSVFFGIMPLLAVCLASAQFPHGVPETFSFLQISSIRLSHNLEA
jgi:hypothetical protein